MAVPLANLAPEPRYVTAPPPRVRMNVVKRDHTAWAHEIDVFDEVASDSVVRVIAIEKKEIDRPSIQLLPSLLPHDWIV